MAGFFLLTMNIFGTRGAFSARSAAIALLAILSLTKR